MLREGWTHALATLGNADTKHVGEILCPEGYEYELDSDFEDEDEGSPPCDSGREHDPAVPEGISIIHPYVCTRLLWDPT